MDDQLETQLRFVTDSVERLSNALDAEDLSKLESVGYDINEACRDLASLADDKRRSAIERIRVAATEKPE